MRGHFLIAALFPPESPLTLAVRLSCLSDCRAQERKEEIEEMEVKKSDEKHQKQHAGNKHTALLQCDGVCS